MQNDAPPTRPSDEPHIAAHRHASDHREEIERSESCGCFYCLAIYAPSRIATDRQHDRALPELQDRQRDRRCVGLPGHAREFLTTMRRHWFGR